MKPLYLVTVREIYEDTVIVRAESASEAKRLVREGEGERVSAPYFVKLVSVPASRPINLDEAVDILGHEPLD